ncbi:ABC transporter permease [Inconstantimicrobium mannanitabidum]|uniref:Uncharacterized protein n=1 Tax=Inconstantimicrobium mannanitabidum TaxID=1604901 RepID=A0ACB5RD71_9CLOT|nr:ABC transporter permease [Clostridium sp. TW13]GKX67040.1 hypothetical protein rsdtw13_22980 [Clostridium sp. TW13]
MYMILKSMKKNKLRNLVIVVQLIFGIVILSNSLANYKYYISTREKAENASSSNVYEVSVENKADIFKVGEARDHQYISGEENQISTVYKIAKESKLVEKIGFEGLGCNSCQYTNEEENEGKFILKSKIKTIGIVEYSKELTEMYNFKMKSGMNFSQYYKSEKAEDVIPMLISPQLSKDNPIGSIVKLPGGGKKYKVIGVLDNSCPLLNELYNMGCLYKPNNGYFCVIGSLLTNKKTHLYIKLKDGVSKAEGKNDFDKKLGEKFETQFFGLDDMAETVTLPAPYAARYILFGIIILVLSSFGIINTVLSTILKRKKEFGTRIAVGATKAQIEKLVIGEFIIFFAFSAFIGLIIAKLISGQQAVWDFSVIGISIGIVFLILVISMIPAYFRMRKMNPVDLVHGR